MQPGDTAALDHPDGTLYMGEDGRLYVRVGEWNDGVACFGPAEDPDDEHFQAGWQELRVVGHLHLEQVYLMT